MTKKEPNNAVIVERLNQGFRLVDEKINNVHDVVNKIEVKLNTINGSVNHNSERIFGVQTFQASCLQNRERDLKIMALIFSAITILIAGASLVFAHFTMK